MGRTGRQEDPDTDAMMWRCRAEAQAERERSTTRQLAAVAAKTLKGNGRGAAESYRRHRQATREQVFEVE